ncbi:MAG: adenylate/guanylate cyclase domain-containing protein, partial [Rhizobiaceae bacterium]
LEANKAERFRKASRSGISVVESEGRDGNVYITKELTGVSGNSYVLGAYFSKSDVGQQVFRAINTFFVGFAGLILAVIVAYLLGRRISAPMVEIAKTARKLSAFDIDGLEPLPGSRIREIDNQAEALNNVRRAMREFARYVPRPLVERLMRSGEDKIRTVEREITIMFSDIVGFTSLSERMNAVDTANILNEFFNMLCKEIEARNGTVDKFMGDGLMAFWGAPDADPDHPAHAVSAAVKISAAISEFNQRRREAGELPIRMRIGIHTGRAVVGNIGGGSRQNYTIVGDSVNLAQRLEQMGRDLMGAQDDAIVLISGQTAKHAGSKFAMKPAGTRILRGREKPVEVYILDTGTTEISDKIVAFPGSGRVS